MEFVKAVQPLVPISTRQRDKLPLAVSAMLMVVVVASLSDVLVRSVSDFLVIWQLFVLRSLIVIPVLITYLFLKKDRSTLWPISLFWITIRSLLLVSMWLLYYLSLPELSLANATAAFHTVPIFIALFALFFGERIDRWGWVGICLGFIGVLVIAQPTAVEFNSHIFLALAAAVIYALAMIITRNRCRKDHPVVLSLSVNLMFLYVGVIATALIFYTSDNTRSGFIFAQWIEIDATLASVVVLLALAQIVASIGIAVAYQNAESSTIGVFDFSQVGFAIIWGAIFFKEIPDLESFFGIFLIVVAGIISVHPPIISKCKWLVLTATRKLAQLCVEQHNKIQFAGYELANIVLISDAYFRQGFTGSRSVYEVFAAVFFIAGSACIWRFDKLIRPSMLFFGGLFLTLGGLFLTAEGYILTGLSVTLASLETMRGGLLETANHIEYALTHRKPITKNALLTLRYGAAVFGWYVKFVSTISNRFRRLGGFINNRPFLTGALIKAPFRLEFTVRKLLTGDFIGAGVGASWMVLGDGGLALNDQRLKAAITNFAYQTDTKLDDPHDLTMKKEKSNLAEMSVKNENAKRGWLKLFLADVNKAREKWLTNNSHDALNFIGDSRRMPIVQVTPNINSTAATQNAVVESRQSALVGYASGIVAVLAAVMVCLALLPDLQQFLFQWAQSSASDFKTIAAVLILILSVFHFQLFTRVTTTSIASASAVSSSNDTVRHNIFDFNVSRRRAFAGCSGPLLLGLGTGISASAGFGALGVTVLLDGLYNTYGVPFWVSQLTLSVVSYWLVWVWARIPLGLGTLPCLLLIGPAISFGATIAPQDLHFFGNVLALLIGTVVFAIGISMSASAALGPDAKTALSLAAEKKNHWPIPRSEFYFTLTALGIGIALSGNFGVGTILNLIAMPVLLKQFIPPMRRYLSE